MEPRSQASDTGIDHINEIRKNDGPDEIVGLSQQKGFYKAFEDTSVPFLLDQAQGALDFVEVRHNQTLFAAKSIFDQALAGLESPPRRILMVEGMYYSWTGGLQFERLDHDSTLDGYDVIYDEIWFDVRSSSLALQNIEFRAYMCSRTHYYLDAFFHLAAQASNAEARASTGIGRFSASRLKTCYANPREDMACLMTGQTSLGALQNIKSADPGSQRVGFVGVGLTKEIGEKFIEGLKIAPGLAQDSGPQGGIDMESLMKMLVAQRAQRAQQERDQDD